MSIFLITQPPEFNSTFRLYKFPDPRRDMTPTHCYFTEISRCLQIPYRNCRATGETFFPINLSRKCPTSSSATQVPRLTLLPIHGIIGMCRSPPFFISRFDITTIRPSAGDLGLGTRRSHRRPSLLPMCPFLFFPPNLSIPPPPTWAS